MKRQCPKCGRYLPLTEEFWYWRNDSQKWRPYCRICHLKNRHKYDAFCVNCGKKIKATIEQIKGSGNVFCSHKCRTKEFISKQSLDRMAVTQFKKGERFSPDTEFKKGEHRGHYFSVGHTPWNNTETMVSCAYCGKVFKLKPYRVRMHINNYCSKKCNDKSKYNGGIEEQRRKMKEAIKALSDKYIRIVLSNAHINKTTETIELKRQQLAMMREIKLLKQEVANGVT